MVLRTLSPTEAIAADLTTAEQAYEQVKELIVTLTLPPGSTIREPELQARLAIGRTPLREALHRLAHDGMVHIYPRRAIVVAKLGVAEIGQVFEMRLALEPVAAALAAERATVDELAMVAELGREVAAQRAALDAIAFLRADHAFHRRIGRLADNAFLETAVNHMQTLNVWLWHSYFVARGAQRAELFAHEPIIDALERRDAQGAEGAMREHIRASKEQLLTGL
jgi:DNA-binding GntR family transcriptional regulator